MKKKLKDEITMIYWQEKNRLLNDINQKNEVSVVIPTKNEINYLPRLIKALEQQTYKQFEIIIVDSNSTDGTLEFCNKIGVKLLKGGLPGKSRNIGAENSNSDYLLFLDADIIVENTFIESALFQMKENDYDAVSFNFVPDSKNFLLKLIHKLLYFYHNITNIIKRPRGLGGALMVKKSAHFKINGFDESIKVAEDLDYIKRISKHFKFTILKEPVVILSTRRFKNEGALKLVIKWIFIEFHRIFLGEIKEDDRISYF